MQKTNITLNNGVEMPKIGLGTYKIVGEDVVLPLTWALQAGLRLIDTASAYKNEAEVHKALQSATSLPFVTSKISPREHGPQAAAACEKILQRLGSVDLLLIHWPGAAMIDPKSAENALLRHQSWRALEDMYLAGRVRAIGVSNFTIKHLELLIKSARVMPMVNQVEVHPQYQQTALRDFCKLKGIAVTAYGSLGCGSKHLLESSPVKSIATEVRKLPAQVLLRWGLQQGCAVIPKSTRRDHIEEWTEEKLLTWQLSLEQMARLDAMPQGQKICWDPDPIG